jgi:hypothetical protein
MKKIILTLFCSLSCCLLTAQETITYDSYAVRIGQTYYPRKGAYYIKSAIASKSLDVKGAVNDNGIPLHLWDFHKGDAQQFFIEPSNEKGYYYIKTKWGRALDISGENSNSEATLHTWDFHGADNQKWQFLEAGGGYFTIKSKLGTCLDVQGGVSTSGTVVWMYKPISNHNPQKWQLSRIN